MPEAGRKQVRGSSSHTRLPAMPEAGDVPGKRENCPPVKAYFPRLRGNEGDRGGPGGPYVGDRLPTASPRPPSQLRPSTRSEPVGIFIQALPLTTAPARFRLLPMRWWLARSRLLAALLLLIVLAGTAWAEEVTPAV